MTKRSLSGGATPLPFIRSGKKHFPLLGWHFPVDNECLSSVCEADHGTPSGRLPKVIMVNLIFRNGDSPRHFPESASGI
jgi:hypothetical protein